MKKKKKKNNKKNKRKRKEYIEKYTNIIKENNESIWTPSLNIKFKNIKTNSWFDFRHHKSKIEQEFTFMDEDNECVNSLYKCKKVDLILTIKQKNIINRWFDAYQIMYNKTLEFIKKTYDRDGKLILNARNIRSKFLKEERHNIYNNSQLENYDNDVRIKCHMLDYAIKLACANYKSALSNMKNGNIKHFRIRYWRKNRPTKILDVEEQYFKRETICYKSLGTIKCMYDGEEYKLDNINHTCKIHYDSETKKYSLFVPEKIIPINVNKKRHIISLDPGIRTFITGVSEKEVVEFATNGSENIKKYIQKIDKIDNNKKIPNKKKKILQHL